MLTDPLDRHRTIRNRILVIIGCMMFLEITRRVTKHNYGEIPLIMEPMSVLILLGMCGIGLYLVFRIFKLDGARDMKAAVILGTLCLALAQAFTLVEHFDSYDTLFIIGEAHPWHNLATGILTFVGILLMLTTMYLALLGSVSVNERLRLERLLLADEVKERKRTEANLAESQANLQSLSAHLEVVREEERTRIAREIHDELGQTLTGLNLELARLRSQLQRRLGVSHDAELFARIDSMSQVLNGTMQTARKIIAELRPGILDDLGLAAAIEWQARDFHKRTGIRCDVRLDLAVELPAQNTTALFRLLQEALGVVAQQGNARQVSVRVQTSGAGALLEITDDSSGTAVDEFGILGIRERVRQLQGEVEVESLEDRGNVLRIRIPAPLLQG